MNDARSAGDATSFPELNGLLGEFIGRVQSILAPNLVGAYVVGSFALGAGDLSSDCDFLVVTKERVTDEQERALRELHDEIPTRPGHWATNLEGSYAPQQDLKTLEALDREWLYVDRGWREMRWSTHCNVEDTRWVLRERGIPLIGPEPRTFACEVPADMLRDRMRMLIESFLEDLLSWTSFEIIWAQRYAVESMCRMLYTLETGEVTSKRAALEWGRQELAPTWRDLITQALADRPVPWDDPPRPGSLDATVGFVEYGKEYARKLTGA